MIQGKAEAAAPKPRINLEKASVLLVENGAAGIDILVQILTGFGAKKLHKAQTAEEAQALCGTVEFDLVLCETSASGEMDGYQFVSWLRREGRDPNRFAPIIMMSGHTPAGAVAKSRDCGANFIIAKPLTPAVLLDRIIWLGRSSRSFVETDSYAGPDRRFKFEGPPNGLGRRCDDLSTEIGQAKAPNMSQEEIDALMQPRRVTI